LSQSSGPKFDVCNTGLKVTVSEARARTHTHTRKRTQFDNKQVKMFALV
jgi:hypothetical protein